MNEKSAADMVSGAENVIIDLDLSLHLGLFVVLWEQADHLLPPCDNSNSMQKSINYVMGCLKKTSSIMLTSLIVFIVFARPEEEKNPHKL